MPVKYDTFAVVGPSSEAMIDGAKRQFKGGNQALRANQQYFWGTDKRGYEGKGLRDYLTPTIDNLIAALSQRDATTGHKSMFLVRDGDGIDAKVADRLIRNYVAHGNNCVGVYELSGAEDMSSRQSQRGVFSSATYKDRKEVLKSRNRLKTFPMAGSMPTEEEIKTRDDAIRQYAKVVVAFWPDYADWHARDMDEVTNNFLLEAERRGSPIILADYTTFDTPTASYPSRSNANYRRQIVYLSPDRNDPNPIQVYNVGDDFSITRASKEDEAKRIAKLSYAANYINHRGQPTRTPQEAAEAKKQGVPQQAPAERRSPAPKEETPTPAKQQAPKQNVFASWTPGTSQVSSNLSRKDIVSVPKKPNAMEQIMGLVDELSLEDLQKLSIVVSASIEAKTPAPAPVQEQVSEVSAPAAEPQPVPVVEPVQAPAPAPAQQAPAPSPAPVVTSEYDDIDQYDYYAEEPPRASLAPAAASIASAMKKTAERKAVSGVPLEKQVAFPSRDAWSAAAPLDL